MPNAHNRIMAENLPHNLRISPGAGARSELKDIATSSTYIGPALVKKKGSRSNAISQGASPRSESGVAAKRPLILRPGKRSTRGLLLGHPPVAIRRGEGASRGISALGVFSTAQHRWNPSNKTHGQRRAGEFYLHSDNPVLFRRKERCSSVAVPAERESSTDCKNR